MMTSKKNKHYDTSLEYRVSMYDRMPYNRDESICGTDKIAICSGNVLKSYSINQGAPCIIDNQNKTIKAGTIKPNESEK